MAPRHPPWLPEARIKICEIGGTHLAYAEMGEGEPIVFVPGYQGTSANFVPQMRKFAGSYRVISIDPIGCGYSDRPHTSYEPKEFVRLTRRLIEMEGLWPANLVGHSLGGAVAYAIATDFPELVLRLALICAYPPQPAEWRPLLRSVRYVAKRWNAGVEFALRLTARPRARASTPSTTSQAAAELVRLHSGRGQARIDLRTLLNSELWSDWQGRLAEIEVPTVIIWGENDRILPVANMRELESEIPHARTLTVTAGHLPTLEAPEKVNEALAKLLAMPAVSRVL